MKTSFKRYTCMIITLIVMLISVTYNVSAEDDGRYFTECKGISNSYTYSIQDDGTRVVASPYTYLPSYIVNNHLHQ